MLATENYNHNVFRFRGQMNDSVGCDVGRFSQQFLIALVTFAPGWNFRERQGRMFPEMSLDLLFRNSISRHDLRVLDTKRHHRSSTAEAANIQMAYTMVHGDHFSQRR